MDNKYKNIRIYQSTYEQLRELKYIKNETFSKIIQDSIDETYKKEKRKESRNQ